MNTIDFTKMRLNRRTRGTRRITLCVKCGRKGEYSASIDKRTGKQWEMWLHAGVIEGAFLSVTDSCDVLTSPKA